MKHRFLFFSFLILICTVSCGDVNTTNQGYQDSLSEPEDKDFNTNDEVEDIADPDLYTEPDSYTKPDNTTVDEDTPDDGCDTESLTKNCTLDNECGNCNICVSGKCSKGCTTDDDCKMYTGLKCNKKLNRCTNVYASLQACGETKCPTGCCFAGDGLTFVQCLTTPDASKCGLCANGEIYMIDQSKCVPAVCSTTSDNCPTLNASSEFPEDFECKSGEFICEETISGESVVKLINSLSCTPAGEECISGLMSDCCSGLPCIDGYCY